MMTAEKNIDVTKFVQNVLDYWKNLREKNSKAANKNEQITRKLAKKWSEMGVDVDVFLPLLHHDSNEVKLSAAGYLIMNGKEKERSASILRSLIKHDQTGVAPMAKIVLLSHKIPIIEASGE